MGQKPLEIGTFEAQFAKLITAKNRARGGTVRSLADTSGVSRSRLDRILRGETSITVTDIERISSALGLESWKVFFAIQTSPLFPSVRDSSRPLSQTLFDEEWRAARVKAGMPSFRFHDLRHTGLTLYAQAGATLSEIMARGRHKHPEVAVRYQHATLERDRANAAVLGAAFG